MTDKISLMTTANLLADAARQETLRLFRSSGLQSDNKLQGGFDPVTEADRASERVMRDLLALHRPEDGILGEEFGRSDGTSGYTWVLDPIDGTRAFITGSPTWGVLISVVDETGPIFGLIDQPYIGERFAGGFGLAELSGSRGTMPLKTRTGLPLDQALLMSTYPEVGSPEEYKAFHRVADRVKLTRYGTDCYGYALLALGQIDLVIEAGLQPYDVCAPIAVVEAAGGIVTDWSGGPAQNGGQIIAAANPAIHQAALTLLNG